MTSEPPRSLRKSTPPKVQAPPEQWPALLKRLPNPLPENAGVQISSANVKATANLNTTICSDCCIAIADVVTNSFSSERWQTVQSEHDTVKYLVEHQHGEVESLFQSKRNGCGLCALLLEQLVPYDEVAKLAESKYSVFIKPRDATRYQLYVCLGDVSRFTRPMREWEKLQAKPLRLFGRHANYKDDVTSRTHFGATVLHWNQHGLSLPKLFDSDPGSDQSFRLARTWLQDCLVNHTSCRLEQSPLPKRLLDLNFLETSNIIYLYLSFPTETGVYATISYTWGASGYKRFKTKNHDPDHPELTEDSHRAGIDVGRFPQTLQDAIYIAKRLGFRYLWIDSVCIVQDDDDDWAEQSAAMTQVYGGARLNISATSGENSEWGILRSIPQHGIQIGRVTVPRVDHYGNGEGEEERRDIFVGKPLDVLDLEDKHLASRGWVFQERLVSVATLHYTDEGMLWECARGIKLEHDQGFHVNDWKKQWKTVMDHAPASASGKQEHSGENGNKEAILRSWNEWIAAYSERELYDVKDRLHAIAGVVKTLVHRFGLTYAAGLWQEDIVGGLMWKRFNRTKTLKRFEGDGTPSWSWASVQGRLEYMDVRLKGSLKGPNLEIVGQAEVEEERPGSFGRVSSGRIQVRGMLQEVLVDKGVHPGVRQREWEEVGVRSGFVNPVNVLVMLDGPFVSDSMLFRCWCLRLGSYDDAGREGDLFLLLEQVDKDRNHFRRVGFAETEAWTSSISVTVDSGRFESAELRRLILV